MDKAHIHTKMRSSFNILNDMHHIEVSLCQELCMIQLIFFNLLLLVVSADFIPYVKFFEVWQINIEESHHTAYKVLDLIN